MRTSASSTVSVRQWRTPWTIGAVLCLWLANSAPAATTPPSAELTEVAKLLPSATSLGFGWSVSAWGDLVIVGAPHDDTLGADAGAAWVFRKEDGPGPMWNLLAELRPSGLRTSSLFGWSVAVHHDTLAVGCPGCDGEAGLGVVFVYRAIGSESDTRNEVTVLECWDRHIEVCGNYIGLFGDRLLVSGDVFRSQGSGGGYLYRRSPGSNDAWSPEATLIPDGPCCGLPETYRPVALGFDVALVGVPYSAGYVFENGGSVRSGWRQTAMLEPIDVPAIENAFSSRVAVSSGAVLLAAPFDGDAGPNSGAAYLYERSPEERGWVERVKLEAPEPAEGDVFGVSVALTEAQALVGALDRDANTPDSGAAFLFLRELGADGEWNLDATLVVSDAVDHHELGISTAITPRWLVVGARGDQSAYVFANPLVFRDGFESGDLSSWLSFSE